MRQYALMSAFRGYLIEEDERKVRADSIIINLTFNFLIGCSFCFIVICGGSNARVSVRLRNMTAAILLAMMVPPVCLWRKRLDSRPTLNLCRSTCRNLLHPCVCVCSVLAALLISECRVI